MTPLRISSQLKRINLCKKHGFVLEALLKNYHLNIEIVVFMLRNSNKEYALEGKKIKTVFQDFTKELSSNSILKALITKKTFKQVKVWMGKMELYLKALKLKQPSNTKSLLLESEKITGILNISVNKLVSRNN